MSGKILYNVNSMIIVLFVLDKLFYFLIRGNIDSNIC